MLKYILTIDYVKKLKKMQDEKRLLIEFKRFNRYQVSRKELLDSSKLYFDMEEQSRTARLNNIIEQCIHDGYLQPIMSRSLTPFEISLRITDQGKRFTMWFYYFNRQMREADQWAGFGIGISIALITLW